MKAIRGILQRWHFLVLFFLVWTFGGGALAQTTISNVVPIVTVQATQPVATANNSGEFTFFRAGNTDATLNVWYNLSGMASNGVDYAIIPPHLVTIAAGMTSSVITITPLTNEPSGVVSKTVVLQLGSSPLLTPVNYEIGSPSNAVVFIKDPVGIVSPKEGTTFYAPTNIQILAYLNNVNSLTNLEFFAGTNDLGKGILNTDGRGGVSGLIWTNPPVGNYALTAVASYNDLAWTLTKPPVGYYAVTSAPVNITVQLPPTNLPPVVSLIEPQNGGVFYTPTNIEIIAKAGDSDGSVTNVEFFAGATDLGPGTPVVLDPPGVNGVVGPVYFLTWNHPAADNYVLTAVATDDGGLSTISAPVKITVANGPPPINLPPVVRIISPANSSIFRSPIDVPIYAYAKDPDGSVVSVEFFAGSTSLGFGSRISPPTPLPASYPTNLFYLVWSNAPVGAYALTAEATDNDGTTTTSDPVKITILPLVPSPTNRPAIVTIMATDPVAVEGTNCWTWEGETNATPTWAAWSAAVCRPFTNCGPKNASFTVRRCGATNDDLTVTYATGGSASNGVDYVALPGAVTIPAGKIAAMITLVPIDDGPPEVNKTVVLKLTPSTNAPPDYLIGYPPLAAAIILDGRRPHPGTGMLPCGCFHLVSPGPDAAWFCIEYSSNLKDWTPVCTNQVINGSIDFVDPDAANSSNRFYRILPILNTP